MAVWRAFIDDSGSDGAPLYPDFSKRPIDPMDGSTKEPGMISPVTSVGLVVVNTNACRLVVGDLNRFRARIKSKYSIQCAGLPKIHMRHLWGKNTRYDKGRNPFHQMPEKDRTQIIVDMCQLLVKMREDYGIVVMPIHANVVKGQETKFNFFNTQRQLEERQIIYSRFARDQIAEKFYKLIMHSTMSLVSAATFQLERMCQQNNWSGVINYDNSDASKGFDTAELFKVLHGGGWATRVQYQSHDQNTNECLLQLADLASFHAYRSALASYRGLESDPFLRVASPLNALFSGPPVKVRDLEHIPFQSLAVHYLVGRQHLSKIDATWVDQHLVTHQELRERFESTASSTGLPIVREASYQHFLAHKRLP